MSLVVKHLYRFGPFDLDAEQRLVRRDGVKISLPLKSFDFLFYMVRNPLRLLTKEELLRAIWPDSFVEEGNLTQNIFLLRKALTPQEEDLRYIVTIPGRGYQFASAVETVDALPPQVTDLSQRVTDLSNERGVELSTVVHEEVDDGTPSLPVAESEHTRAALAGSSRRTWGRWLALAGLLLAGAGAGSFFWWRAHQRPISS